jgi:hypothetical protein
MALGGCGFDQIGDIGGMAPVPSKRSQDASYALVRIFKPPPHHQGFHCYQQVRVCPLAFAQYSDGYAAESAADMASQTRQGGSSVPGGRCSDAYLRASDPDKGRLLQEGHRHRWFGTAGQTGPAPTHLSTSDASKLHPGRLTLMIGKPTGWNVRVAVGGLPAATRRIAPAGAAGSSITTQQVEYRHIHQSM